jgi:nucleotide-binding universal stress UspA family protein
VFKHLLLPTDGSRLAAKGVKAGVKLAKALGAKVTGVYVIPRYIPPVFPEAAVYVPELYVGLWRTSMPQPMFLGNHAGAGDRRGIQSPSAEFAGPLGGRHCAVKRHNPPTALECAGSC